MIKVCEKYFLSSLHRPFLGALYCFFYQRVRNLAHITSRQFSAAKKRCVNEREIDRFYERIYRQPGQDHLSASAFGPLERLSAIGISLISHGTSSATDRRDTEATAEFRMNFSSGGSSFPKRFFIELDPLFGRHFRCQFSQ